MSETIYLIAADRQLLFQLQSGRTLYWEPDEEGYWEWLVLPNGETMYVPEGSNAGALVNQGLIEPIPEGPPYRHRISALGNALLAQAYAQLNEMREP